MYNQYDPRWKNDKLGNGTTTIGTHGCNVTCLAQGLVNHGWDFTPATLNTLFKRNGSYSKGSDGYYNLISPSVAASKNQEYFIKGWSEQWNDANVKDYLLNHDDCIVIGEVDARGIGGSGQHFVLLLDLVIENGKITNTLIGDPWGGLEQLVTTRYAKYGCIKSLRVYQVKNNKTASDDKSSADKNNLNKEGEMYNYFLDVDNYEAGERKLIEHLGIEGKKCAWGDASGKDTGGFLGSERRKVKELEAKLETANSDLLAQDQELERVKQDAQDRAQAYQHQIEQQKKELDELREAKQEAAEFQAQSEVDYEVRLEQEKEIEALKKQVNQFEQTIIEKNKTIDSLQAQVQQLKNGQPSLWEMLVARLKELLS